MSLSTATQGIPQKCKIAGRSSCGEPPVEFSNCFTKMYFDIHNFADREEKRGESFETGTITAHGHPWKLKVYPWGGNEWITATEHITVYLIYAGNNTKKNPVVAKAVIRTKTIDRHIPKYTFSRENKILGWPNFATRNKIINNACDEVGTLTIEVDLEVATGTKQVWYPQSARNEDIVSDMYSYLQSPIDVTFIVGNSGKERKTHKSVLALRAKELHELVLVESSSNSCNTGDDTDVKIELSDVDETEFDAMIKFIYTGKEPTMDNEETAKSILLTADRFGCTELKLFAESSLVDHFLATSTATGLLLFADSHSCALLKEASMELYASNPTGVMKGNKDDETNENENEKNDDWTKLEESPKLLSELLRYTNLDRKQYSSVIEDDTGTPEDADNLNVTSLRERLQKADLDVDGSREMLVERWKEHLRLLAN